MCIKGFIMFKRFLTTFSLSSLLLSSPAFANEDFLNEIEITVFCIKDAEQILKLELADDNLVSEENSFAAKHLLTVCENWVLSDFQKYQAFFSEDQNMGNAMYALIEIYEGAIAIQNNSSVKWIDFKLPASERKQRVIPEIEKIKERRQREINQGLLIALQ